jgi:translation initiation factor IF-2
LVKEEKCKDAYEKVVFFCVLKIMPHCVFNKKDLIVADVNVIIGVAKV